MTMIFGARAIILSIGVKATCLVCHALSVDASTLYFNARAARFFGVAMLMPDQPLLADNATTLLSVGVFPIIAGRRRRNG
jgi:hypothetical protein